MPFKFATLYDDAQIPSKGSDGSAGYDIRAYHDVVIEPGEWKLIKTGVAVQVPIDCYVRVAPRSGLALKFGIQVGAGVIDSDYRDGIGVILFNHSQNNNFEVKKGDRIAQLIFEKIHLCDPEIVDYSILTNTERGTDGFGSTGVN
jgi:dUTP pyrophosphatase